MVAYDENLLHAVQQCELEILKEIDLICRKHKIRYFAIGGTALGAVRHHGFIPWDDDIDIAMPRKDYERFLSIAPKELPALYFIQNFHTEKNSPFYFTKIRKRHTKFVEYYLKNVSIHHGVFVDIFPFDHVPSHPSIKKIHFFICYALYQLYLAKSLSTACSTRFERKSNWKSRIRRILHLILLPVPKNILFHSLDYAVRFFNKYASEEIAHIVRKRLKVRLDSLYPRFYQQFEDIKIPLPAKYDEYLSNQFGDYMTLPPVEKRYGHLPYYVSL